MIPPPCTCGETATGLVVEGHLHPYCAWQAERAERAEAKVSRVQDVLDDAWIRLSPDAEAALKEAIT